MENRCAVMTGAGLRERTGSRVLEYLKLGEKRVAVVQAAGDGGMDKEADWKTPGLTLWKRGFNVGIK